MSYREERRADKAAEREQDRKDNALLREEGRRDRELADEQRRKDAADKRRQEAADRRAKEQEKARKKAARAARIGRVVGWLNRNPVTVFVAFVMASSVIPAVISQVGALGDAGVYILLAALLAAMLEGGAWALTFMGKAAEDAGRPAGKYRVGTWCTALVAAAVNYWHWAEKLPDAQWVAVVFAASSLFAIYLWDMKTHGSQGRTKEERREAKASRKHAKQRRKDHPEVVKTAERLMSAAPYGALDEAEAFAAALRIEYGTDTYVTPELLSRATSARLALGAAIEKAEGSGPELARAGLLTALVNPVPAPLGTRLPVLGDTVPLPVPTRPAETPTTQFPQGKRALEPGADSGPQGGPEDTSGKGREGGRNSDSERAWEQRLPDARIAADELVAEGRTISATALAKHLKIRREDAMKLRDAVIAERKGAPHSLHLVTNPNTPAVAAATP